MSSTTNTIRESLPDATEAEVNIRFINAYGDGKPEDEKNQEGGCQHESLYFCALMGGTPSKNSHMLKLHSWRQFSNRNKAENTFGVEN